RQVSVISGRPQRSILGVLWYASEGIQRYAAEPFPPSGAVLARSPDVAPERDRRQGAHCCADTPLSSDLSGS
ncbi:hypothetical protein, partial [Citrobacter portucalensis]|uniref:hypothetical protein n=1 Tax=Citrobacter portucalensis TaxID=1639133 RepID=UPI001CB70FF8